MKDIAIAGRSHAKDLLEGIAERLQNTEYSLRVVAEYSKDTKGRIIELVVRVEYEDTT